MNPWLLLGLAIVCELMGSTSLRLSQGFQKPLFGVLTLLFLGLAFYLLSQVLLTLPLGVVYAIWTGVGVAATFAVSAVFFRERVTLFKLFGIALIISSVVALNLSGPSIGVQTGGI